MGSCEVQPRAVPQHRGIRREPWASSWCRRRVDKQDLQSSSSAASVGPHRRRGTHDLDGGRRNELGDRGGPPAVGNRFGDAHGSTPLSPSARRWSGGSRRRSTSAPCGNGTSGSRRRPPRWRRKGGRGRRPRGPEAAERCHRLLPFRDGRSGIQLGQEEVQERQE